VGIDSRHQALAMPTRPLSGIISSIHFLIRIQSLDVCGFFSDSEPSEMMLLLQIWALKQNALMKLGAR
jgi:hypothetical protein